MTVIVVETPTKVSVSTTIETTQNKVVSMLMMRVSAVVIFETGRAETVASLASTSAMT